ncbi:MFS transporter [Biostraticola tofi]|uniref:SET family sugar efflux transporter-like MFS transporter n=1 Tax=Biostraticola tofi TaxID=466109 RepID=A0A4R3YK60_9GAMM|nr:MFS transporter [Biostraticola tofi]TCV92646.1 SET family sugar efflux transporter-like MFS transporter [Biostraticola tofi]
MLQRRINWVFIAFLLVSFLIGIAGALQMPTLSLFLTNEVGVGPLWVGLFYAVTAIAGIIISFFIGRLSDKRGDRRMLLLTCCLVAVCNCVLFAFNRHYWVLLSVGMLLASVANAATPQLFALAREHADRSASKAAMFNSLMRAQMSLAWVLGPPLAFLLALNYGFMWMFLSAALAFVVSAVIIALFLPSVPMRSQPGLTPSFELAAARTTDIRMLFVASLLMWTCNSIYIIDMPLYITKEMGLPQDLAGILMGVTAGVEIPFMLLAGHLAQRLGKKRLMLVALIAGIIFYAGMYLLQYKSALIILALFNAIFIGIVATIGIIYFQDLMPGRAGVATTLYTNSLTTGVILAGVIQGGVVQYFSHHATYGVATVMMSVSLLLMLRVREA